MLIVSLGEATASAPSPTVVNRMCRIYTWSRRHSAWVFLTYFLMVEQEGQELSHKLSLNEKSLVEQEHATESSLYCKQLVSICVIFYNPRSQS